MFSVILFSGQKYTHFTRNKCEIEQNYDWIDKAFAKASCHWGLTWQPIKLVSQNLPQILLSGPPRDFNKPNRSGP